jgi:hypothetical protein
MFYLIYLDVNIIYLYGLKIREVILFQKSLNCHEKEIAAQINSCRS